MIRYSLLDTDLTPRAFLKEKVQQMGLKQIGSGAFATVYSKSKSSRVVYKMAVLDSDNYSDRYSSYNYSDTYDSDWSSTTRTSRISTENTCTCKHCMRLRNRHATPYSDASNPEQSLKDDGYFYYLENVVLKHQDNPLMPKIKDVEVIGLTNSKGVVRLVYIVKMERLRSFDKMKELEQVKLLWRYGLNDVDDIGYNLKHVLVRDQTSYWKGLVKPLRKMFQDRSADLHDGNIMVRGRGKNMQLVLTDPVT